MQLKDGEWDCSECRGTVGGNLSTEYRSTDTPCRGLNIEREIILALEAGRLSRLSVSQTANAGVVHQMAAPSGPWGTWSRGHHNKYSMPSRLQYLSSSICKIMCTISFTVTKFAPKLRSKGTTLFKSGGLGDYYEPGWPVNSKMGLPEPNPFSY